MKRKFGILFMVLGSALVVAALALFLYNEWEQNQAAESSAAIMPQLVEVIQERQEKAKTAAEDLSGTSTEQAPELTPIPLPEREMTVVEINGHGYIGFVGIPALKLELPVMATWSYPKLTIAPCRYTGGTNSDDLVIMAHNYQNHFGRLSNLRTGDTVTFTDMDGETITYEVVALDVLAPSAVAEMTAGDYDLTLFTCTYGGRTRVTVRCDRVEPDYVIIE